MMPKRKATEEAIPATPAKLTKTYAATKPTELSPEDVLTGMSSADLRKMIVGLLNDEVAGPVIKESLLAPSNVKAVSAHLRAVVTKEYQKIVDEAEAAISEVYEHAFEMKGMEDSDAWPDALSRFLPLIRDLLYRDIGTSNLCAALAWNAAFKVSRLCNLPGDGSECRIQEGEEQCDSFHDLVDDLMVEICEVQQSRGNFEWFKQRRVDEAIFLAKSATAYHMGGKKPADYRYKKVVGFLETIIN